MDSGTTLLFDGFYYYYYYYYDQHVKSCIYLYATVMLATNKLYNYYKA